ncbi:MAG: anaerobic glycerol-3-phosphate dehydrogenase subunit C [Actinomycetota bacterium]
MTTDIRASLDHCVKCTICETYCPVSAATPLFPGPKYVGPQAERFRSEEASVDESLDYCSGCGICSQVCPQGVKIAEINARARERMKAQRGVPLRDRVIARPSASARLATPVAPLANLALASPVLRYLAESVIGVHRKAPLPRFASRTFQKRHRRRSPADSFRPQPAPAKSAKVVYFHGCGVNFFEPRLGEMAVAVLERNGFEVVVPPQDCCGLPLQSNGLFSDARAYVRRLAANLAPYARAGIPIVSTSTSCSLMLKREAHEILGEDSEDLAVVSEQMYDICELLAGLLGRGELDTRFQPLSMTVPYHAPCQQRGHGIGSPALDLLELIPGLAVLAPDAPCCGIAGTYGLKKEKYDIAMAVGRPLFESISELGATIAACDSETCRWQIAHATGVPVVHPIELLHRAYVGEK